MQVLQQTAPTNYLVPESLQLHSTSKITSHPPIAQVSQLPIRPSNSMVGPMSSTVSCSATKTVSSGAQAVFQPPVSTCTFCRTAPGSLMRQDSSTSGASGSTVPERGRKAAQKRNVKCRKIVESLMIPEHEMEPSTMYINVPHDF